VEQGQSALESMGMNSAFWSGRSVFLTGHTGFKGGWMGLWLSKLGAKVHGYSLEAPTSPNFFTESRLQEHVINSVHGDIRDLESLLKAVKFAKPSIVIHMAAQSLVCESYNIPVDTFTTNVIGTVNVLEAVRKTETVEAVVNITTDKCYENREWLWPYRENDRLGGHDPYSSSKACAEIAAVAYRDSYLKNVGVKLASARAGNVIGGGDWASDRLIPDFLRAIEAEEILQVRSPNAVRPWQHVLEPLAGYLTLAEKLVTEGDQFADAWNFGPEESDSKTVSWVVNHLCKKIPNARWELASEPKLHEAGLLKLDSSKAKSTLGWRPRWALEVALDKTIDWHHMRKQGRDMAEFSIEQISEYSNQCSKTCERAL
jgi:CDP-glucose 4,6-dehydratase